MRDGLTELNSNAPVNILFPKYFKISSPTFCAARCQRDLVRLEASARIGSNKETQVDILIRKNGINHFVIEVKTTIGYNRPDETADEPYRNFSKRIELVAKNFEIPPKNVVFVLEEPSNVSKIFQGQFWNPKSKQPILRNQLRYPLSQIYPLFWGTDPYYWKWDKKTPKEKRTWCPKLEAVQLFNDSSHDIVTPFADLVDLICS